MNLSTETKVIDTQYGEPGLALDRYGPDAYEVVTDHGIEVRQESDVPAVEGVDPANSRFRTSRGTRNRRGFWRVK